MLKRVVSFLRDESGFDLVQFSVYTGVAVGALAFVWFFYLKNRIHTAGNATGQVIERGYTDAQQALNQN